MREPKKDFEKRAKRIVEDARTMTYAAVGRKHGLSRQRVAVIVNDAAPDVAAGRQTTAPITVQARRDLSFVLREREPRSWAALAKILGVTVRRARAVAAEEGVDAEATFAATIAEERSVAAEQAVAGYRAFVKKHGARPTLAEVMRDKRMRKAKRFKGAWMNGLRLAAGDVVVLPGRPSGGGMPLRLQATDPRRLLDG